MQNSDILFFQLFDLPDPVLAIPEIGSKTYVEFSAMHDISETILIYADAINLFDYDPPLPAGALADGCNTYPATFDVIGRQYFLGFTMRY